jgi:hypothetical protein
MKNSSRFDEKNRHMRTRSSSGSDSSAASSSSRALYSTVESSRLRGLLAGVVSLAVATLLS